MIFAVLFCIYESIQNKAEMSTNIAKIQNENANDESEKTSVVAEESDNDNNDNVVRMESNDHNDNDIATSSNKSQNLSWWKCTKCDHEFLHRISLIRHYNKEHKKAKFSCENECGFVGTKSQIKHHKCKIHVTKASKKSKTSTDEISYHTVIKSIFFEKYQCRR